jgi:hypothetical protein
MGAEGEPVVSRLKRMSGHLGKSKPHPFWIALLVLLLPACPKPQRTATPKTTPSRAEDSKLPAETPQEIDARMKAVVRSGSCDRFVAEFAHSRDKERGEGPAQENYCNQLMPQLTDFQLADDSKASAMYQSGGVLGVKSKSPEGKMNRGDMALVLDTDGKYKMYDLVDAPTIYAAETSLLSGFDHKAFANKSFAAIAQKDCAKLAEVKEPPAPNEEQCKVLNESQRVKDIAEANDPKLIFAGGNSTWVFYRVETDAHAYTLLFNQKQQKFYFVPTIYPYK